MTFLRARPPIARALLVFLILFGLGAMVGVHALSDPGIGTTRRYFELGGAALFAVASLSLFLVRYEFFDDRIVERRWFRSSAVPLPPMFRTERVEGRLVITDPDTNSPVILIRPEVANERLLRRLKVFYGERMVAGEQP